MQRASCNEWATWKVTEKTTLLKKDEVKGIWTAYNSYILM